LDTGIKNNKFLPLFRRKKAIRFEAGSRIETRWSASSERMSSLTIRILSVNIIAIMILGLGILYLGEYTDSLVEGELQSMESEARFMAGAISEGAVRPVFQISPLPRSRMQQIEAIKPSFARRMVRRLGNSGKSRIILYGAGGMVLADTQKIPPSRRNIVQNTTPSKNLNIGDLFDQSAGRFLSLIPTQAKLEPYPDQVFETVTSFPDSQKALNGELSASAWEQKNGNIILTAAAPIQKDKNILGVVLLIHEGTELEEKIESIRVDVFRVFLGSLGITVMLSIYLSGLIGQPLKKLAIAAESVRTGKGDYQQIPDMSDRGDEIGELSVVLRDMTQALWDRMDTIERFAADVSHELKNPLTSVRSAIETAAKIKDEKSRQKLMDIIHHDIQRLDRLISDISTASRLDAELTRDEMVIVHLDSMLRRVCDAYKAPLDRVGGVDAEDNKIKLQINDDAPLKIYGNEDRLIQVFGNLISNAISFSPDDQAILMTVQKGEEQNTVEILVEDHGPGIPDNKIETIFDRFYTERPKHESYGSHSGLGLSISKQIIDAHDGEIFAENILENNKKLGARFIVRLRNA